MAARLLITPRRQAEFPVPGIIDFQVHSGGLFEGSFGYISIQILPRKPFEFRFNMTAIVTSYEIQL
ncbi:MAG: hypothetical protein JWM99_1193 [Verrucomicrobiales bacterium]|nr:hypothetical protein [Verrucomicrobiales bacterium]